MAEQIVFYVLSSIVILGALGVVLNKNAVHSSLLLGASLAGVGGLYALLGWDFLFAAQIMVYVSGIAVLIMFVVMLLGRASDLHLRQVNDFWIAALIVCLVAGFGLWKMGSGLTHVRIAAPASPSTKALGLLFMGDDLVAFELVSVLLTAALLGAVLFSHSESAEKSR